MIDFPNSPTTNQVFTSGALSWTWDGTKWKASGAAAGGSAVVISSKSANYSVLAGDVGQHFDNQGAAGTVVFTLPLAAPGLFYAFSVDAAQIVRVLCNAADHVAIAGVNSAAGGNAQNATPSSSISVECHKATQWVATSATGAWSIT